MSKISELTVKLKKGIKNLINNPSFTLKEQLGYSGGTFGNAMAQDMVGTFITLFLTKYVGIEAGMITLLMLITRVVTIVEDPIVGGLLDRGFGKNNRRLTRPFLLFAPIPYVLSSILLFVVPAQSMTFRVVWVFCLYLIFSISYAIYETSLFTMSLSMTNNPDDRKNFYAVAQFAAGLGTTLPGGVIPLIISLRAFKDNFEAQGKIYLIGTIIFGILGFAAMILPYFTLREKIPTIKVEKPKVSVNAKAILQNKPLWLLVASSVVESIRQICYGALVFFYMETLNAFWLSTVVGVASVTLSYIGVLLVPVLGKKMSARTMLVISYMYSGICYGLLLVTGYKVVPLVGILIALSGFPNGLMGAARNMLLADSTDYMEWKTWKKYGTPVRSDGMVVAVNSMAKKINSFWKELLLPAALTYIGYKSAQVVGGVTIEAVQTPETLKGIFYLVAVPGFVGNIIPGLIMLLDNFTGKRKAAILAELKEMRAGLEAENSDVQATLTDNTQVATESATIE